MVLRRQISARCTHQWILITTEHFCCRKNKTLIYKLETGNRSSHSEIRSRNAPLWSVDWKTIRISLNNSDHKLRAFKNVYIEPEVGNTFASKIYLNILLFFLLNRLVTWVWRIWGELCFSFNMVSLHAAFPTSQDWFQPHQCTSHTADVVRRTIDVRRQEQTERETGMGVKAC